MRGVRENDRPRTSVGMLFTKELQQQHQQSAVIKSPSQLRVILRPLALKWNHASRNKLQPKQLVYFSTPLCMCCAQQLEVSLAASCECRRCVNSTEEHAANEEQC